MARLINDKYLFIHIAKTGGTFFREALNACGVPSIEVGAKHASWLDLKTDYEWAIPVMFIRHPVSWYRSRWRYAKMTYFKEKLRYMPEAQKHWMAPVWHDDYYHFVERTLKHYPGGIATDYFEQMMPKFEFKPWKYEELTETATQFIEECGFDSMGMDNIWGKPLDSSKVKGDELPFDLVQGIIKAEERIIKTYYNEQVQLREHQA